MASGNLTVEMHVLPTPKAAGLPADADKLVMTVKRYTKGRSAENINGLTLLFTHCIGAFKEEWELVIDALFTLHERVDDPAFRIREAWSFDRQNHGDAGLLNRQVLLESRMDSGVSLPEWSAALASFVRSPFMDGHRMVTVGHSAGSTAWVLTTLEFPLDAIPYVGMIPVETTMVKKEVFERELEERMSYMDLVVTATKTRRSHWPSKADALTYFTKRFPWNMWDVRSVQLMVEHGLSDSPKGGVELKGLKEQEAISYPDTHPHFAADTRLGEISHSVPVHVVWGERIEFIPEYIRESLSDPSDGRTVASVSEVEDAGHMVVQEKPELLAQTISKILFKLPRSNPPRPGASLAQPKL